MKAKDKAIELRDKMFLKIPATYNPTNMPHYQIAKEIAIIAVDEIIAENYKRTADVEREAYWEQVKAELEKN
jgi:hypothetical protein